MCNASERHLHSSGEVRTGLLITCGSRGISWKTPATASNWSNISPMESNGRIIWIYPLVICASSPWKITMLLIGKHIGKPSIHQSFPCISHGYVSHNQRLNLLCWSVRRFRNAAVVQVCQVSQNLPKGALGMSKHFDEARAVHGTSWNIWVAISTSTMTYDRYDRYV